jgi:dTMP kinase
MAYQGYGRKLGAATVRGVDQIVCGTTQPDMTLLLDLSPRRALARAHEREAEQQSKHGRFEVQGFAFHERVRGGYLAIAKREPRRVKLINADQSVSEVQMEIRRKVDLFLKKQERGSKR